MAEALLGDKEDLSFVMVIENFKELEQESRDNVESHSEFAHTTFNRARYYL